MSSVVLRTDLAVEGRILCFLSPQNCQTPVEDNVVLPLAVNMFSRRSQSTVIPPHPETSHGAPVSILNSGLAFALMEEKDVVNLFKKLSDTHMQCECVCVH